MVSHGNSLIGEPWTHGESWWYVSHGLVVSHGSMLVMDSW